MAEKKEQSVEFRISQAQRKRTLAEEQLVLGVALMITSAAPPAVDANAQSKGMRTALAGLKAMNDALVEEIVARA